jgi:hypothetical protein
VLLTVLAQPSFTPLAAQASKGVHVCLGTDNLLRFTTGERCPQGQRMFRLAEVEDEVGITKERDDPPNAVVADLKTKVDFLTRRVTNLEAELRKPDNDPALPTQVKAPFEVVDKRGAPIFVVTDAPYGLVARKGAVHIGRGTAANLNFWVHDAGMRMMLATGEAKTGGGALLLYDRSGRARIDLYSESGIVVGNSAGKNVVNLFVGPQSAGQLLLRDANGAPTVEAGTLPTGDGVVRAGPAFGCTPMPALRVPICIRGRTQ